MYNANSGSYILLIMTSLQAPCMTSFISFLFSNSGKILYKVSSTAVVNVWISSIACVNNVDDCLVEQPISNGVW